MDSNRELAFLLQQKMQVDGDGRPVSSPERGSPMILDENNFDETLRTEFDSPNRTLDEPIREMESAEYDKRYSNNSIPLGPLIPDCRMQENYSNGWNTEEVIMSDFELYSYASVSEEDPYYPTESKPVEDRYLSSSMSQMKAAIETAREESVEVHLPSSAWAPIESPVVTNQVIAQTRALRVAMTADPASTASANSVNKRGLRSHSSAHSPFPLHGTRSDLLLPTVTACAGQSRCFSVYDGPSYAAVLKGNGSVPCGQAPTKFPLKRPGSDCWAPPLSRFKLNEHGEALGSSSLSDFCEYDKALERKENAAVIRHDEHGCVSQHKARPWSDFDWKIQAASKSDKSHQSIRKDTHGFHKVKSDAFNGKIVKVVMEDQLQCSEERLRPSTEDAPPVQTKTGIEKNMCGRTSMPYANRSSPASEDISSQLHTKGMETKKLVDQDPVNEVCFIFDTSSDNLKKFSAPMTSNMETFWDLTSKGSDRRLRLSVVTPQRELNFTSNKDEFLAFSQSALRESEEVEEPRCGLSVLIGLRDALPRLKRLSWTPGNSNHRFVYIFTNLAAWSHDEGSSKSKSCGVLSNVLRHLPATSKVLVGTWMKDNDLLVDALVSKKIAYRPFGFLDVKSMASCVVPDNGMLRALYSGMATDKTNVRVKMAETLSELSSPRKYSDDTAQSTSRARQFQIQPFTTIQDIAAAAGPKVAQQLCWIKREVATVQPSGGRFFYSGWLGDKEGQQKEHVMMKSLEHDRIVGMSGKASQDYYERQAFVAAAAQCLAYQYNNNSKHKPDHCAKIQFLKGFVITEAGGRNFYAEQFAGNEPFTEFCDTYGKWDETHLDETLLRFVQTTFKLSGGDFMLAGLKGIRLEDRYLLTVPFVLSKRTTDPHVLDFMKEHMKLLRDETKALLTKLEQKAAKELSWARSKRWAFFTI
jgi:hypothetical protein